MDQEDYKQIRKQIHAALLDKKHFSLNIRRDRSFLFWDDQSPAIISAPEFALAIADRPVSVVPACLLTLSGSAQLVGSPDSTQIYLRGARA